MQDRFNTSAKHLELCKKQIPRRKRKITATNGNNGNRNGSYLALPPWTITNIAHKVADK
jgi:hypothetical protein